MTSALAAFGGTVFDEVPRSSSASKEAKGFAKAMYSPPAGESFGLSRFAFSIFLDVE
jgi:hypothetical protein